MVLTELFSLSLWMNTFTDLWITDLKLKRSHLPKHYLMSDDAHVTNSMCTVHAIKIKCPQPKGQ